MVRSRPRGGVRRRSDQRVDASVCIQRRKSPECPDRPESSAPARQGSAVLAQIPEGHQRTGGRSMTPAEHRAEAEVWLATAEVWLNRSEGRPDLTQRGAACASVAHVHAMLAGLPPEQPMAV